MSVIVVGVGADGWEGLAPPSKNELRSATVIVGSERQLSLIPPSSAIKIALPSPLFTGLPKLLAQYAEQNIHVLASGDPMFYGIGVTLVRLLGSKNVRVIPHPSSASLACARLGWTGHEIPTVSLVNRPVDELRSVLTRDRKILLLSENGTTPQKVADYLVQRGYGWTMLTVLEQLGGPEERIISGLAQSWQYPSCNDLNIIALECISSTNTHDLSNLPGLPDEVFDHDGQITKREIRALTLAALSPLPGEVLWDVGSGSGSVAIEWLRSERTVSAVCFEADPQRAKRIMENAVKLGVPRIKISGSAPQSFGTEQLPDVIFLGGGVTQPGLLKACWDVLEPGGRIVVNAVTIESEAYVFQWFSKHGGNIEKVQVYRGGAVGKFTTWRPQLPITQWRCVKPEHSTEMTEQ
ncbi:MAG: precorrin-6y C5,15-methyltransferase (decarboxylating) subunit CbiE [Mycobacteriaceae bacterium]